MKACKPTTDPRFAKLEPVTHEVVATPEGVGIVIAFKNKGKLSSRAVISMTADEAREIYEALKRKGGAVPFI